MVQELDVNLYEDIDFKKIARSSMDENIAENQIKEEDEEDDEDEEEGNNGTQDDYDNIGEIGIIDDMTNTD